jgi:peptide/nickel transport system substrate-binding protein
VLKRVFVGALVVGLIGTLTACGNSSESTDKSRATAVSGQQSKAGDAEIASVEWGVPKATTTLDPWGTAGSDAASLALTNAAVGLLSFDAKGGLRPALARRWEEVDPLTYTYEIDPDARFPDGSRVTTEDVVFSMARSMNPKTGGCCKPAVYANVKTIRATGPNQITVKMKSPDPTWPNNSASEGTAVFKKATVLRQGKSIGSPDALPLGAGPYRIAEFVPDDHVTFERNPHYWGTPPKAAKVVLRYIKDSRSIFSALQSGSIDGTFQVPASETPSYRRIRSINLVSTPSLYYKEFDFNVERKPFDDVHVRRAFAYAWDRQQIVDRILHGNAEVASAVQAPWLWRGATGLSREEATKRFENEIPQYPYDMDRAREELKQSSVPNGFTATVQVSAADPDFSKALQILSQSLKQLNINLKVKETEYNRWAADLFSHDYDLMTTFNLGSSPQPVTQTVQTYSIDQAKPNGFNFSNYKNPKVDSLLKEILQAPEESERADLLMEVMKITQTDLPVIFPWWDYAVMAIDKDLVFGDYGVMYAQQWAAKLQAAAGAPQ